jgi:hypothetical protein
VYGWRSDVYKFGDVAIVTGYAPFGNIEPSYDVIQYYERKAEEIIENNWRLNTQKDLLDKLIQEFLIAVAPPAKLR